MALQLDRVIPWGRSAEEYARMFRLTGADTRRKILDCGGGPAAFTAEATAAGCHVISADPLYQFSGAGIRARFDETAESVLDQVLATPGDWVWTFHLNPEALLESRRAALATFLEDYEHGMREGRYVTAELPALPFPTRSFGIALCSHLMFLYSDLLSEDFHVRAVRELCRIADEVRIFPLLTCAAHPRRTSMPCASPLHRTVGKAKLFPWITNCSAEATACCGFFARNSHRTARHLRAHHPAPASHVPS